MTTRELSLDLDFPERQKAGELWQELTCASSQVKREAAQRRLSAAAPRIQQAVINEIAAALRQRREPQTIPNPFVELGG